MEDKIQIVLEAVEQAKAQIDQAISDINRLNDANEKSAKSHHTAAGAAKEHAIELAKFALETFALVEGLKALVETAIELPAQMERMAAAAGATVEAFSTMAGAAQRSHVENSLLSISLKNLASATADALRGDANRIAQFKSLGIETDFLKENQNNLLAILLKVSDAFHEHADGVNKSKIAQDLFGRSSRELVAFLDQGSGKIEELQGHVKELGGEISETAAHQSHELNVSLQDFKTVTSGLVRDIVQSMLPAFTQLLEDVAELAHHYPELTIAITGTTVAIVAATTALGPYAVILGSVVTILAAARQGWLAYKAAQEEALTHSDLEAQQVRFSNALKQQVDDLQEAGKITAEESASIKKHLEDSLAHGNDKEISETERLISNRIRVLKELEAIHNEVKGAHGEEGESKSQLPNVVDPGIAKARADASLSVAKATLDAEAALSKATLDNEQKQLDQSLANRLISVDEWVNQSLDIMQRGTEKEAELAEKTRDTITANADKAIGETSDLKEIERLNTEKTLAQIAYQKKIDDLIQQSAGRRLQIEQTTEEKSRGLIAHNLSEVHSLATQAQTDFQTRLNAIDFGESRGRVGNAYKEIDQAQDDYLDKLQAEQDALDGILSTMEEINRQHPGTFSQADIEKVKTMVAQNGKQQVESEEEAEAKKKEIRKRQVDGVRDMFGNMAILAKSFGKEGFAAYKAFAIAQATIDTARAAIAAYQSVVGIPYVGPVLAPIAAGVAVAAGAVQIANISAQKYAAGGVVRGPGTGKSDSVPIMASDGEYVIDADTTQQVGEENMAKIHEALRHGGIPFHAAGGLVSAPRSGSFAGAGATVGGQSTREAAAGNMKVAFIETRNHLRAWMREEGVGIAIDGFGEHGNQVVA